MTKKHSTKRALIASALSLVLCFSMLLGTTFAWFTDSAVSSGNVIKTGSLNVELYHHTDAGSVEISESQAPVFDSNINWEPGRTEVRYLSIKNAGNLALKYKVALEVSEPDYTGGSLTEVMSYEIIADAQLNSVDAWRGNGIKVEAGTNATAAVDVALEKGAEHFFAIAIHMDEAAGNEYQEKEIAFDVKVLATQLTAESDSFNDQYDAEATYPDIATGVIEGGESLKASNVTVTLPDDAEEANYTFQIGNKTVTTDENGETTVALDINLLKDGVKPEAKDGVYYALTMEIEKNVVVTELTHNGEAITNYSYNPTTGLISFDTDSFSPFTYSYSTNTVKINSADELVTALTEMKNAARAQYDAGDSAYRENAIIVLENDIVVDANTSFMYTSSGGAPFHLYRTNAILDLNGHNITVKADALLEGKSYANAVLLVQYSNLDIIGEGSIIAENKSIPVYGWANGTIDIYGGNYVTNASARNESAVYVNNPTIFINVYGGTFTNTAYAFNVHDANCGTTTTITLHEGVTYIDFFKNGTTDLTKSDLNNGRIAIADGCELVNAEGINTVVKK